MHPKTIPTHYFLILIASLAFSFTAKSQLTAAFSATPTSGCAPQVINFTDLSTGSPTQWQWDLGNGTTSFLRNPSGTYFTPGQYTIRLIVSNATQTDTLIKTQYITLFSIPVTNFTATPTSGCVPLNVQFSDGSSSGNSPITQWLWDFGDGTTGTTQNPAHTYNTAGNFTVTLRVTNAAGCSKTISRTNYIQASNGVTANFTNTTPTGCRLPITVNFTNTSTGTGTLSYLWFFGDGSTSTLQHPSHTYLAGGNYTVTLRVTSSTGCMNTRTKTNAVVIQILQAGFTNPLIACVNDAVSFTNTTTPTPTSVIWTFGDGGTSTAINPTYTYTATGVYSVKMIATRSGCSDSITRNISVMAKPTVAFTAGNRIACRPPLTVNFTNTSTGGSSYNWDFGDGNTSTAFSPSHTYTTYGSFHVKLVVSTMFGCSDSLILNNYVQIVAPKATINSLPRSGCAPLSWTFTSTISSPDPVVSYLWDFGNGFTSTAVNPTHVFTTGIYDIKLIVTTAGGCTDTAIVTRGIVASDKPTANFSATPRNVCAFTDINFTNLSSSNVTRWRWEFGDGGTSTLQNPIYQYQDTGFFTVRLIVWNVNCPDTLTLKDYIYIKAPIASFTPAFVCTDPFTFTFTDRSIGPDTWLWNFGDGATSTLQNNVHTYSATGTYTVSLFVTNIATGCSHQQTQTFRIVDEVANFNATNTVLCRNSSTTFSAIGNTPGTISSFQWNFGDGQTGTGQTVAHTYVNAGLYSVRLIITDISGCKDTLDKIQYIRVNGPVAKFSIPNGGSCLNSMVVFVDSSSNDGFNPIVSWVWNFGDGNFQTFTAPPFTHTYVSSGTYNVTLKTIDALGCSDSTTNARTIIISKPIANFTRSDTLSCPGRLISFTNTSTGPSLSYQWKFGNGATSTLANPSYTFNTDGIYQVSLLITDQYGCRDSITKNIHIQSPRASFTISDSVSTCPPLIANFTNTSVNGYSYKWDFGNGSVSTATNPIHIYNEPGVFIAMLVTSGPGNNCSDTVYKRITISGPSGVFTYNPLNGCSPHTVNFVAHAVNNQSFVWDFNDGAIINTPDSTISYTYTTPGAWLPKVILVDASGCQVPIVGVDTINVYGVKVKFGYDGLPRCDMGIVQFSDSSILNDINPVYNWSFGDGGTSNLQNPSHFYAAPGRYTPQLIVTTNRGCTDTAALIVPVQIVAAPNADFTNAISGCTPVSANFNAVLNVPDTSVVTWRWNLGNGTTSTLQNPPTQTYTTAQINDITLIATNSSGCMDTVIKSFEVYPIPVINAGPNLQICRGTPTQLTANGGATYVWSPAVGLSCTTCANPMASPNFNQKYIVRGSSIYGCQNFDSLNITVIQPFAMTNKLDDTLCIGGSVRLFADGANSYEWTPSSGLSNVTSAIPMASPKKTTTYRVVGSDAYGCFKDTGYTTIRVYPIPMVDAGKDITMKIGGQPVVLKPTISPDVTWTQWLTSPGIVAFNTPNLTVKPLQTTKYTVEVRNDGGCKASDNITVFVICDNANVFIPNTFTPNGDGANDIFFPRGSGIFKIKLLRIFNRWGEVVFEKVNFSPNDPSAGWDGTVNGVKQNSDVFVYTAEVLCENNTPMILNGNIALIR